MALACLREGYPLDIPESQRDIALLTQQVSLFFFFSQIFLEIYVS